MFNFWILVHFDPIPLSLSQKPYKRLRKYGDLPSKALNTINSKKTKHPPKLDEE